MLQNYLRKCKETYFLRWNKYLCIYKDTFERRYLEMIAHWIYGIILAQFGAFSAMWHFLWMGCHGFFLKATMGILLKSAFGKRDTKNLFLLLGKKIFFRGFIEIHTNAIYLICNLKYIIYYLICGNSKIMITCCNFLLTQFFLSPVMCVWQGPPVSIWYHIWMIFKIDLHPILYRCIIICVSSQILNRAKLFLEYSEVWACYKTAFEKKRKLGMLVQQSFSSW